MNILLYSTFHVCCLFLLKGITKTMFKSNIRGGGHVSVNRRKLKKGWSYFYWGKTAEMYVFIPSENSLKWITAECCHHVLMHMNCCGTKWGFFFCHFSLSLHTFLHTKLNYQTYIRISIVMLLYNRAHEFLPRFCDPVQSIDTCVDMTVHSFSCIFLHHNYSSGPKRCLH